MIAEQGRGASYGRALTRRTKSGRHGHAHSGANPCLNRLPLSAPPARWAESFCNCWKSEIFPAGKSSFWPRAVRPERKSNSAAANIRSKNWCPTRFNGVDIAIGSTPDEVAKEFVPWAVERGCIVVDESGYWRMNPDVPLVIPEVNPDAALNHKGIIASPNCSTTQLVVALKPLHDAARVKRVVVSTYQATSGAGLAGCRDLENGTQGEARRRTSTRTKPLPTISPST